MTSIKLPAIDEAVLQASVDQAVSDLAAAVSGLLLHLGDRLGLYKAMAGAGPLTTTALAQRTGIVERYVREWLCNQAIGGYVRYRPGLDTFELSAEQAMVLADEDSPVFLGGAFELVAACYSDHDLLVEAFRTGTGISWDSHDHRIFTGVARLSRPRYAAHLVGDWLPSLDGVEAKLRDGASVADVGCGRGASAVILAEAFTRSTVAGFDGHAPSVEAAHRAAVEAGVSHRVRFQVASATDFPGQGFDLVCLLDALHDTGNPVGAARHIRQALAADGTLLLVEPTAGATMEQNLNPIGRAYCGLSTVICTPRSQAQETGLGLGAQAGEERLTAVLRDAGFRQVRWVTQTPFSLVLEARP